MFQQQPGGGAGGPGMGLFNGMNIAEMMYARCLLTWVTIVITL